MELNVTTAVLAPGCNTATASPSLAQWDTEQVLQISGIDLPDSYKVEFSTVYTRNAIPAIGDASGVTIPNVLLQRSAPITAYIVLYGENGGRNREYWITIYITPGQPPETITPDPEQEDALDQAIAALEAGAAKAEAAAEAIQDMDVEAETLAAGSAASVEKTVDPETGAVTLNFGIPKGDKGNPGNPGQDGMTPDFRIGTVETLNPGQSATATITGTPAQPVLNLGIPQGEKGDPGGDSGTSDYTQLSNKPQINGHTLTGNQSAADLGLGTYSKPSGGIPKTDLAQGVQQSLNKADSALQTAPVQSVAGKTGAVNLGAGDVGFDGQETYEEGSVGAKLGELSRHLSDVEDAVTDTQGMLATVEATATASKSYAVGDLLVFGGELYTVTSIIAAGATITPGTNVISTTIETQLQEFSSIEKPYEFIKTVEVEEATRSVVFDSDNIGNSLRLEDVIVVSSIFTYQVNKWLQLDLRFSSSVRQLDSNGTSSVSNYAPFVSASNASGYILMKTNKNNGYLTASISDLTTNQGALSIYKAYTTPTGVLTGDAKIEKVIVNSEVDIPAGTRFGLYGVRSQ